MSRPVSRLVSRALAFCGLAAGVYQLAAFTAAFLSDFHLGMLAGSGCAMAGFAAHHIFSSIGRRQSK